ncbi:hypothetical protein CC86DRAFT_17356 [Ophiobolus disseminans]|uniref:Uncharacterized protein n=1 Tax=Ophiobolus disseminans TaxID=1469910 RepID=A0A6A7ANL8_9PLEO|nr:hypothetical protein CC86DRAFT_17356 [Ophiobolus disseminans]
MCSRDQGGCEVVGRGAWLMCGLDGVRWWNLSGDPIMPDMTPQLVDVEAVWEIAEAAVEMYTFAHRYDISLLEQAAVDRLGWCYDVARALKAKRKSVFPDDGLEDEFDMSDVFESASFVSTETIRRAYELTEAGNPVRRWLVMCFTEFFCFDRGILGRC